MRLHTVPTLLDRFFADPGVPQRAPTAASGFRPAIDIHEYEDRYELVADLPGVRPGDVDVEFKEGVLRIRGERSAPELPAGVRVHRRARLHGSFSQSLVLGDEVAVEGIEAKFRDGVLTVRVPRSERSKPRQIPVSAN